MMVEIRARKSLLTWGFLVIFLLICISGFVLELVDDASYTAVSGDSMEHGDERQLDIIDDGDGAIITPASSKDHLRTYFEGRATSYSRMGDYGDVVLFRVNGGDTKFIHRLLFFIEYNNTLSNATVDIPELGHYNISKVVVEDYGYYGHTFAVNFSYIYNRMVKNDRVVLKGYITIGDNRDFADQMAMSMFVSPVRSDDILGRVTVVDNELVQREILGFTSLLLVPILFMFIYLVWILMNKRGKGIKHYGLIIRCALVVSLAIPLVHSVKLIQNSSLGSSVPVLAASTYIAFALVATGLGIYFQTYNLKNRKNDPLLAPMTLLVLLVPIFYLMKADLFYFYQSLVYLIVVNSIYQLDPDRFFAFSSNVKKDMGAWTLIMGANLVLFLLMILVTWPPLLFLGFGTVSGCIFYGKNLFSKHKI